MAEATADALAPPKAVRLGVLVVGFPRKPFTVPASVDTTLADSTLLSSISEVIDFETPNIGNITKQPDDVLNARFAYLCLYVALAAGEDTPRFLRLDDADAIKLIRPRSDDATKERYISETKLIPETTPLVSFLASRVKQDAVEWQPQEGEIHIVVAVAMRGWRMNDPSRLADEWMEVEWHPRCTRRSLFYSRFDIEFHRPNRSKQGQPIESFRFLRVLREPRGLLVPAVDKLVVVRRRCEIESRRESTWMPPQPRERATPPRLSKLAADATLPLLLQTDPLFLDPVDCVIDAKLTTADGKIVRDNVICYIKFLPSFDGGPGHCIGARRGPTNDVKGYVNSAMLEQIDWVVTAGDERGSSNGNSSSTPLLRLLVLVKRYHPRDFRIDMWWLPTDYATVVVEY